MPEGEKEVAESKDGNIGAGVAGGAALGAVIALGAIAGGLLVPVIGAFIGAGLGGGAAFVAKQRLASKRKSDVRVS